MSERTYTIIASKSAVKKYFMFCLLSFCAGLVSAQETMTMHQVEVVAQSLHKLTWKPPTERENGDPLSEEEIVGYKIERSDDAGTVLETVELDSSTLELALTILPNECNNYVAYARATDGTPTTENSTPGTLESKPTASIRVCVIPPKKPRDFAIQ